MDSHTLIQALIYLGSAALIVPDLPPRLDTTLS